VAHATRGAEAEDPARDRVRGVRLRARAKRVLHLVAQAAEAARSAERRSMMGSGGRAEKIRTYRWKEAVAVDHRVEESFPLHRVLGGAMDELVEALQRKDVAERVRKM